MISDLLCNKHDLLQCWLTITKVYIYAQYSPTHYDDSEPTSLIVPTLQSYVLMVDAATFQVYSHLFTTLEATISYINDVHLAQKQQIPRAQALVLPNRGDHIIYHRKSLQDIMLMYFKTCLLQLLRIVVVTLWQLDLQLPMQPVSITTKVVSSNPTHYEM